MHTTYGLANLRRKVLLANLCGLEAGFVLLIVDLIDKEIWVSRSADVAQPLPVMDSLLMATPLSPARPLIRADTALYITKNRGRNWVVCAEVIAEELEF